MANIIDVAKAANVSPATASRALNNSQLVSDEKKARVWAAAEKLGYQLPARAPEAMDVPTLSEGIILCIGVEHEMLQDYMLRMAQEFNSSAMFFPVGNLSLQRFRAILQTAVAQLHRQNQLRAMLIGNRAISLLDQSFFEQWKHIPIVQLAERSDIHEQHIVSIDCGQAAYDAVNAMLELGYHRLYLLTQNSAGERLRSDIQFLWGYRAAMGDAGITIEPSWIDSCDSTRDSGTEWVNALIARGEALPEVIMCTSDHAAIGCIQALQTAGIQIPKQTAVLSLGCDSGMGYATSPMLSTVEGRMETVGDAILRMMQLQLNDGGSDNHRIVIPHTFFCRGSIPQLDPTRWSVFD